MKDKVTIITPPKERKKLPKLTVCILLDVIGCINYILPFLGEFTDIIWAPVSAIIFNALFGGKIGKIGAIINFIEEIIPFTDIIPTFTIAYFIRKYERENT